MEGLDGEEEASTKDLDPTPKRSDTQSGDDRGYITEQVWGRLFSSEASAHRIGRYLVLEPIGQGGMGSVYAAYDEQLDRKVAIKVLREDELPTKEMRLRFLREAQALARLSHPHVVTVHEVGEHEGQMFLAMEFVRGQSLRQWIKERPAQQDVLRAFVQAGRGLVAAHDAGLVHRDFKPSNVVRGGDGVVKVLDFGLARALDYEGESASPMERSSSTVLGSTSSLTVPGAVMGTPAYMSPEQHVGDELDERSDQYSFCVAVWEGLSGRRPFPHSGYNALVRAKHEGPPSWPESGSSVSRRVVEALRRGLATDPRDRWPSIQTLLDVLEPAPRSRRALLSSVVAGLAGLGLGALALRASSEQSPAPCTEAAEQLADVWAPARRDQVRAAILDVDKPYARDVWTRTERILDEYASHWIAQHTDACEATAVRGEQSPQMLDLRMGCLQRASGELRATVDALAGADTEVVQRAYELTAGLPLLSRCSDAEALAAEVEPPSPHEAVVVEHARQELARSRSLEYVGQYAEALAAANEAGERLVGVEYGPIRTELALRQGAVLNQLGDYDEAESTLSEALELAARHGQQQMLAEAVRLTMVVVGSQKQLMDEALRFRSLARGLVDDRPLEDAKVRQTIAIVLHAKGDYPAAEIEHRAAISKMKEVLDADSPRLAMARIKLGLTLMSQGRMGEAALEQRAGLEALDAALGSMHPKVAWAHTMLGSTLSRMNELDAAESEYREAISIYESAVGSDGLETIVARTNLANVLRAHEKFEEAEVELRAMIPLMEEALGADHPNIAKVRVNFSSVLRQRGSLDEAEREIRAALDGLVASLGPDHLHVAAARMTLANTLNELRRTGEAEAELRRALSTLERSQPPDHPFLAATRANLARRLMLDERYEEARQYAEDAWARQKRDDVLPQDRANAAHTLAQVLWNVAAPHRDRGRARTLVEDTVRVLEAAKDPGSGLPELRQWLEAHPDG